ncbi:hypothetical protein ACFV7Q_21370 [Streptomyces sp. NPDC059851]|uniref:hypothetical protein n=1 Tax=Streptomyces sp. NPDC059851 TaxID=3346971 RepID=UPI003664A368
MEAEPQLIHRVYRCTLDQAGQIFGPQAAASASPGGLWDVHRYLTMNVDGAGPWST